MPKIYNISDDIAVESGSIVSKRLFANANLHADLYALDKGEEIDKEKLFGDSLAWAIGGEISLFYESDELTLKANDACLIQKGVWRKFIANSEAKLLLITFKENIMIDHLKKAEIFSLAEASPYQEGKIVSKTLVKNAQGTVTLMSFDGEQELATHAAPGDALLVALDGELDLTIGDDKFHLKSGDSIVMPGKIPHGLKVKDKFKMLLIVTRD